MKPVLRRNDGVSFRPSLFRHCASLHSGFDFRLLFFILNVQYTGGYFLTFTVRGSWRHGDARGSWQRNGIFISPTDTVDALPNRNPPHIFTEEERRIIEKAFNEVCAERQWELHEVNVRSNHVHVVLTAQDVSPESVMRLLKSKATMRLRKSGHVASDEKIWTQHGSTKYLFDEQALQTTCEYVRNQ